MENPGKDAEDFVEKICRDSYFADFVVRRTIFTKPSGKHIEAGDLLIPFKNTLITFQVKSKLVNFKATKAKDSDLQRVVRKVEHAINQIKTVKRAINTGAINYVENLRGIQLPFHAEKIQCLIGIVVLDIVTPPNFSEKEKLQLYNGLKDIQNITIHVFLRGDLELIVKELDTIPDLIHYLEVRESLMKKKILFPLTNEIDFLAMYQTRYDLIEQCLRGKINLLMIQDGMWKAIRKKRKEYLTRRAERHGISLLVDGIIEAVHQCIGYAVNDEGSSNKSLLPINPGTIDQYLTIAEEFAGLNRVHRMEFGSKMLEKAHRADHDKKRFSYFLYRPGQHNTPILFLSFRGDRIERRNLLYKITSAAYVYFGISRIVGIATENYSTKSRSHDFLLAEDISFENEEELRTSGSKIFKPANESSRDQWGNDVTTFK